MYIILSPYNKTKKLKYLISITYVVIFKSEENLNRCIFLRNNILLSPWLSPFNKTKPLKC